MNKSARPGFFGNIAASVSDKIIKRPEALAMVGNIEFVRRLDDTGVFSVNGIDLVIEDFTTADEIIAYINSHRNAGFVMISDICLSGESAMRKIVLDIREYHPDVVIAFFINNNKENMEFKNWAYGHKVYGFFCSDDEGQFDFKQIVPELLKLRGGMPLSTDDAIDERKKQLHEEQKMIDARETAIKEKEAYLEQRQNELVEKDRHIEKLKSELLNKGGIPSGANLSEACFNERNDYEASILKTRIADAEQAARDSRHEIEAIKKQHEDEKEALAEHMRLEMERYKKDVLAEADADKQAAIGEYDKKIKDILKENSPVRRMGKSPAPKFIDTVTIGVFSITHGAGSTYTSALIGEHFADQGYSSAIIALDGKDDLACIKGKFSCFMPDGNGCHSAISEAYGMGFNIIIFDLGVVFPIANDGTLSAHSGSDYYSERKYLSDELHRCKFKVALGFSDAWNLDKLSFFIENDVFRGANTCLFAIDGISNVSGANRIPLELCERKDSLILEKLSEWLGISIRGKQPADSVKGKLPKINIKGGVTR